MRAPEPSAADPAGVQQQFRKADESPDAGGIRSCVEGSDTPSLSIHDRWVVGDHHRVNASEGGTHPGHVLVAAYAVGRHHDPPEGCFLHGCRGTAADLERLRGGLDHHDDDVYRIAVEPKHGPQTRLEVSDDDTVGTCELPEQLLR